MENRMEETESNTEIPKTPKRSRRPILNETATPRRSARKSIKIVDEAEVLKVVNYNGKKKKSRKNRNKGKKKNDTAQPEHDNTKPVNRVEDEDIIELSSDSSPATLGRAVVSPIKETEIELKDGTFEIQEPNESKKDGSPTVEERGDEKETFENGVASNDQEKKNESKFQVVEDGIKATDSENESTTELPGEVEKEPAEPQASEVPSVVVTENPAVIEMPTDSEKSTKSNNLIIPGTPVPIGSDPLNSSVATPRNSHLQLKLPSSTPIMRPDLPSQTPTVSAKDSQKKLYREHPTPYKKLHCSERNDTIGDFDETLSVDIIQVKPMAPIENEKVLRSIRKRSVSVSEARKKSSRVTFHSPANTTFAITEIDELMKSSKNVPEEKENSHITQRRKRSLSVAQTEDDMVHASEMHTEAQKIAGHTPHKVMRLPAPTSRSKMPNFAAIHQQSFDQMESISDHLQRKAERAKVLSGKKVSGFAPQSNKNVAPKARQKLLDLCNIPPKLQEKTVESQLEKKAKIINKLPDPRSVNKFKPAANLSVSTIVGVDKKATTASRANFNLSTIVASEPKNRTISTDKFANRKDMYKGRTTRTKESNKREIIKGVRSNRRFELQMEYRNRTDV